MAQRDAVHRVSVRQRLEQGLATWRLVLRFSKTPAERKKALDAIRSLSRQLAMTEGDGNAR